MKTKDLISEAVIAVGANKGRVGLTILGITIGIASVIAMLAIGAGAQASIEESVQSLGSNLLTVVPGSQQGFGGGPNQGRGSATSLTIDDAEAIAESVERITAVSPEAAGNFQLVASGTNTNTSVIGTTAAYIETRNYQVALGSFVAEQHVRSRSRVVVLGPTTRDDLFGVGADPVGERVRINSVDFTVVGVLVAKGSSGFSNPDSNAYVPITTAQQYLTGSDSVSTISLRAQSEDVMTQVEEDVTQLLALRHGISDPEEYDFDVVNQADLLDAFSGIAQTFTILLASIASISLLVGGIGIMNMMLTSVTERTHEIGLRKSLGAKRKDISRQFLVESVIITVIGGAVGIVLGWLVATLIGRFGLTVVVSLESVILAFSVAAVTGVVFGFYPARRAANLNPIDALRYE